MTASYFITLREKDDDQFAGFRDDVTPFIEPLRPAVNGYIAMVKYFFRLSMTKPSPLLQGVCMNKDILLIANIDVFPVYGTPCASSHNRNTIPPQYWPHLDS